MLVIGRTLGTATVLVTGVVLVVAAILAAVVVAGPVAFAVNVAWKARVVEGPPAIAAEVGVRVGTVGRDVVVIPAVGVVRDEVVVRGTMVVDAMVGEIRRTPTPIKRPPEVTILGPTALALVVAATVVLGPFDWSAVSIGELSPSSTPESASGGGSTMLASTVTSTGCNGCSPPAAEAEIPDDVRSTITGAPSDSTSKALSISKAA